jgi:flavin-dependent dehydrogenase
MDADVAQELSIAGGGPAGLACGIRLLQRGRAVALHERGAYPLKKVCGGFLSPRAWALLVDLGADEHLPGPPRPLRRARFYADGRSSVSFDLSPHAWGLRRAVLDSALAARFRALGGRLMENSEWKPEADGGAVVLDARGRGAGLPDGPWMGWKGSLPAGAAPAEMADADLLMLPLDQGYAGLAWMDDASVCVSLIARRGRSLPELLQGHPVLAPLARHLRADAAISGFSLQSRAGASLLGDRHRVWPPLVGDGIYRALASGQAAASALTDGLSRSPGVRDPSGLQFALALGLHTGMLRPWTRRLGLACLRLSPSLATRMYQWTRF